MTELLAILTVIFVVYSLYEVFKTACQPEAHMPNPAPAPPVAAVTPAAPPPPAPSLPAQAPAPASVDKIVHLKDPSSGEISPVPSNYRFAKKWIKEALVAEGLLNKIYKNSELNESANAKVKEALDKFKKLEKYHA